MPVGQEDPENRNKEDYAFTLRSVSYTHLLKGVHRGKGRDADWVWVTKGFLKPFTCLVNVSGFKRLKVVYTCLLYTSRCV